METDTVHHHHHHPPPHHLHHHQMMMQQREERRNRCRIRKAEEKLSLESYLSFFLSRNDVFLTVSELNQIISMHGFKKIKSKKVHLVEALNSIDHLIDPSRSTLRDCISSQAFMTVDDVIKDLAELNWQECCVTSIKTINSVEYDESPTSISRAILPWGKKRPKSQMKLSTAGSSKPANQANVLLTAGSVVTGKALTGATSSLSSAYGEPVVITKKRRQRRMKKLHDVGGFNREAMEGDCAAGSREKAMPLALEYS